MFFHLLDMTTAFNQPRHHRFLHTQKQLKSKFKKILDMRYSYSCKEYVIKIS